MNDKITVSQQLIILTSMQYWDLPNSMLLYQLTNKWPMPTSDTQGHLITKRIASQWIKPRTTWTYTMHSKPLSYKAIMGSIHTIAIMNTPGLVGLTTHELAESNINLTYMHYFYSMYCTTVCTHFSFVFWPTNITDSCLWQYSHALSITFNNNIITLKGLTKIWGGIQEL